MSYYDRTLMQVAQNSAEMGPETVSITVLNTRFGEALQHTETLDVLFPAVKVGHYALVGLSELTPGVRAKAVKAIAARGYIAVIPEGDGANIDTLWAVSPGLEVDESASVAQPFPGRTMSRPSKRHKRERGRQVLVATTPLGNRISAGTERLIPPIAGRRAHLRDLGHMAVLLDQRPNDPVDVYFEGGDHNHADGPGEADNNLFESRGYSRVLDGKIPTYNIKAANRITKVAGMFARLVGISPSMRFDEAYLRPGIGRKLVSLDDIDPTMLSPHAIGYASEVIEVKGTDHHAVRTKIVLSNPKSA